MQRIVIDLTDLEDMKIERQTPGGARLIKSFEVTEEDQARWFNDYVLAMRARNAEKEKVLVDLTDDPMEVEQPLDRAQEIPRFIPLPDIHEPEPSLSWAEEEPFVPEPNPFAELFMKKAPPAPRMPTIEEFAATLAPQTPPKLATVQLVEPPRLKPKRQVVRSLIDREKRNRHPVKRLVY